MKRLNIAIIAFFFLTTVLACKTAQKTQASTKDSNEVQLTAQLEGDASGATLNLFQFDGLGFEIVDSAKPNEANVFQFTVPAKKQFYYLGPDTRNRKTLILGTEAKVTFKGNWANMSKGKVIDSPLNEAHDAMKVKLQQFNAKTNQLMRSYSRAVKVPEKAEAFAKQLAELDKAKVQLLDSLKTHQPYLAKIAGMSTYLSFPNNKGTYPNEIAYFIKEYFRFTDLTDSELGSIPPLFEQFRNYSTTLAKVGISENLVIKSLDEKLAEIPSTAESYRYALGGIVNGLMRANSGTFVKYGEQYLDKYGAEETQQIVNLRTNVNKLKSLVIGGEAPDFSMKTPEGESMKLSDLRGKIVMVDFWASWCGPCRRENPNVVALYNKYNEKGFEILGVSLDRTKKPWLQAIEKDGLTWHHVSDLKGWKNEVAQMYNVTSIPQTLLLDQEGKIIARNLRGEALAQRLAEIFDD